MQSKTKQQVKKRKRKVGAVWWPPLPPCGGRRQGCQSTTTMAAPHALFFKVQNTFQFYEMTYMFLCKQLTLVYIIAQK